MRRVTCSGAAVRHHVTLLLLRSADPARNIVMHYEPRWWRGEVAVRQALGETEVESGREVGRWEQDSVLRQNHGRSGATVCRYVARMSSRSRRWYARCGNQARWWRAVAEPESATTMRYAPLSPRRYHAAHVTLLMRITLGSRRYVQRTRL